MADDGVLPVVQRAFAAHDRTAAEADIAVFAADYAAPAAYGSRPFPRAVDTLRELDAARWHLALSTNKPEASALFLLAAVGLEALFPALGGRPLPGPQA